MSASSWLLPVGDLSTTLVWSWLNIFLWSDNFEFNSWKGWWFMGKNSGHGALICSWSNWENAHRECIMYPLSGSPQSNALRAQLLIAWCNMLTCRLLSSILCTTSYHENQNEHDIGLGHHAQCSGLWIILDKWELISRGPKMTVYCTNIQFTINPRKRSHDSLLIWDPSSPQAEATNVNPEIHRSRRKAEQWKKETLLR